MDIKNILLTPSMVKKIQEFNPKFNPLAEGFEIIYDKDFPLNNWKLEELVKTRFKVIGEDEEGCYIYSDEIEPIPPIDIKRIGDKYQVVNGRHRVITAILKSQKTILFK